jgi:hypothetical protein
MKYAFASKVIDLSSYAEYCEKNILELSLNVGTHKI